MLALKKQSFGVITTNYNPCKKSVQITALLYFARFTEKRQLISIHAGQSNTMFDEIIVVS